MIYYNYTIRNEVKTMSATREEMRAEAIKRLEFFKMPSKCINEFKKGNVWFSEGFGSYEMTNEPKLKEFIKEFENKHNFVVYHAIHNMFEFGECWSLLYVSNDKDDWKYDNDDLLNGYVMSYVWNVDDDFCSEFGTIGVKGVYGAIHRSI